MDKFKRISWEEALSVIQEALVKKYLSEEARDIKVSFGKEAKVVIESDGYAYITQVEPEFVDLCYEDGINEIS